MGFFEVALIAVGLSMDAFAISVCKGLANPAKGIRNAGLVGLYFGVAQAVMPLIGYFLGAQFAEYIMEYDHWVVFVLLAFIGGKMILEAMRAQDDCEADGSMRFKNMIVLALATSIDALAVGISLALLNVNVWAVAAMIGVITFALSFAGYKVGAAFGVRYKKPAEILGGAILILMGAKILLEHLGVLSF